MPPGLFECGGIVPVVGSVRVGFVGARAPAVNGEQGREGLSSWRGGGYDGGVAGAERSWI